jgi:hypothetical protein
LANFPATTGGGSSVSYYLNGSVSQGTIGGVAYREVNRTPIFGAGTDISTGSNGYIASFITDAGDPNKLLIPAGNWNLETYFSANNGGGSPTFYVELYKYNGTTFTLIATSSGTPELIAFGTNINPYFTTLAVPETVLALTDRLALRYYVNTSGRTITLHTENGHLCQIITTFTTGLTALNGLTSQVQFFAVGTSGTDFAISSATDTHTFNFPTASATNRGALSSADWTTFNNKQNALTNPVTGTGTSGQVAYFNGTSAITSESGFTWDATNNRLSIGGATANSNLTVNGSDNTDIFTVLAGGNSRLHLGTVTSGTITYVRSQNNYSLNLGVNTTDYLSIFYSGNIFIGTSATDAGYKLDVNGTGRFSGQLTSGSTTAGFINAKSFLIGTDGTETNYRYQFYLSSNDLKLYSRGYGDFLTINYSTGAATFSSSVTAGGTQYLVNTSTGTNQVYQRIINTGGDLILGINANTGAALAAGGLAYATSIYNNTNTAIQFGTNAVFNMTIAAGGNVGIGTNNPVVKFQINDGTNINLGIKIGQTDSSAVMLNAFNDGAIANIPLEFRATKFGFQLGNVGIGTTTPDVTGFGWKTLTIRGGTTSGEAGVLELQSPTTTGAANLGIIAFLDGSNRNAQISVQRDSSTTTGNMLFYTNAGAGIVERLRITSGGSVGINNTSPMNSVWGSETSTKQLSINASSYAVINLEGSTGRKYSMGVGDGNFYMCYDNTAGRHNIVVSSGGNVLINTTTSGSSKLRIVGLPTSAVGLSSGDVYNLSGVLMIA